MVTKREPWKTDNWFVSPWNFIEEVTKDLKLPKQLKIHDSTIRDGEQQAGIIFTRDEKVRIAEKLSALGVDRIEAGMPVVSPEDEAAVKEIVKRNLGPEIFVICRSVESDIRQAADCGVNGVGVGLPVNQDFIEHGLRWSLDRAIEQATKATLVAKELGLYTSFGAIDSTRAEMDWYFNAVERVAKEGHMDSLVVLDTFGVLSPHGASNFIRKVKERVNKPVEIHFHNTLGLAVANTIAGILSGADVIHTTVTGIGDNSGNCCFEEVVMALLTLYGINVNINYEKLYEVSSFVNELAGTAANRPIVGKKLHYIETGEFALIYKNVWAEHPTILSSVLPRVVGHPDPEIVIGKKNGMASVELLADKLGIALTQEEGRKVVTQIKKQATEAKRLLTEEEFQGIVRNVKAEV